MLPHKPLTATLHCLAQAEEAIEMALDVQERNSVSRTVSEQAREAAVKRLEDSVSRQVRALEKQHTGRLDDA